MFGMLAPILTLLILFYYWYFRRLHCNLLSGAYSVALHRLCALSTSVIHLARPEQRHAAEDGHGGRPCHIRRTWIPQPFY
ncbi:hypothetical protein CEXT_1511 [Caerostris extrusa]|uniref:Secreted protein n=1 Tax=Caerostris extrusa TaxID=172846 RepID=A0AAV4VNG6_CAEEX|nr:hypothetical protein CEXT_1511 [Caerostris extrusa]